MKTIIGRKQSSDNETFVRAWQHIEELVSKDEAAALVSKTVEHIKAVTAGKNVGYAWSGGKDSLALQYVCELAGIKNIRTKSLGSNNKQNVVLATIEGLSQLKTPEEVANKRGKAVSEIMA